MSLDEINALTGPQFLERFGFLFEHSPWVVAAAERKRPFASAEAMEDALIEALVQAGAEAQLALLRAHPELAGKAAIANDLTAASAAEQRSAGLDRLTPEEFTLFHELNQAYRARFGFPFIICVRLTDKFGILTAMRERTRRSYETEFAAALVEVAKIVRLRLKDTLQ